VQLQLQVSGTPVNTFTFPDSLPGTTTADRTFLVATANFVTLYGITPDYIIPPNFLSGGANHVLNYGGFDQVSLANLPTNGVMSLNGLPDNDLPDQTTINAQATPRNFAGEEVTIPEPATVFVMLGAFAVVAVVRRRK
jgi:hypothetical protein